MRPAIIAFFNDLFGVELFQWLVPTPAVLYLLAALAILVVYDRRARRAGLESFHVLGAAIWGGVGGLLGARLGYLLLRADQVVASPAILLDPAGTTISWGAYAGGVLGFILYLGRHHEPVGRYADVAGSTLGLGPAIGRLACFLNGDDYGAVTSVPWGVSYPEGSFALAEHAARGLVSAHATESLTVHPVQLYLAANGLLLFLGFTWLLRRGGLRPGSLFLLYWVAYGVTRFGLEYFREPYGRITVAGFPDGQLLALVTGLAAAAAAAALHNRRARLALVGGG
jgi:phosphatidylglycerol:prolipoprotein diacylglycerol transferase